MHLNICSRLKKPLTFSGQKYGGIRVMSSLVLIWFFSKYCLLQIWQKYFNIALVMQDKWLTILTHPANTCTCPLKVYAIKNIRWLPRVILPKALILQEECYGKNYSFFLDFTHNYQLMSGIFVPCDFNHIFQSVMSFIMLMFLRSLYCKQYGPRSDCSKGSCLIMVHCFLPW